MLKNIDKADNNDIVNRIESVSGEIQLLALNIAVAAARIAHKQDLGVEVNQKLSQLVNHATQTVKQINQILNVAGAEKKNRDSSSENELSLNGELVVGIENAMNSIISDSEKIARLLAGVKKR